MSTIKRRAPTDKTVGHHIKIARKQQKMTVEQLARKVNMQVRYIEAIERDEITKVPANLLHRIAVAVGEGTIADLLGLPIKTQGGWK